MCRFAALCLAIVVSTPACLAQSSSPAENKCTALASLSLDHAKVVSAAVVTSGSAVTEAKFKPEQIAALPAFCRVRIEDRPSADSDIKTEVWLPLTGWNGRFRGQGNGGFAGSIYYDQMASSISDGYATAATDTGHSDMTANFALGHPEKIKDFGWRAIHDMTLQAKQVVAAFYGKPAQHTYFAACSDGGREALMEAQRFPADYDGILAGAPAYNWTALVSSGADDEKQLHLTAASNIPVSKLPAIAGAIRAACDAKDGVTDGILNDPRACHFDPATLACKQGDADTCLTPPQVVALKNIYTDKRDAQGHKVYPGYLPGAEDHPYSWPVWVLGDRALMLFFSNGYFSDFVYQQPDWKLQTFDFPRDYQLATERTGEALNATDPNLQPFLSRGGRLIVYHGFNDPAIPALGSIDYVDAAVAKVGKSAADKGLRLYLVPGMLHCGSGPGANDFGQDQNHPTGTDAQHDILTALEQWVEQGTAPAAITATKFTNDDPTKPVVMTRPICPYPQLPKYLSGDTNSARSFTCSVPKP